MKNKFIVCSVLMVGCCLSAGAQNTPRLGNSTIDQVIEAMTLEEKIYLLTGAGQDTAVTSAAIGKTLQIVPGAAGITYAIPRLGIPALVMADGPAGLRIEPEREGTQETFYCTYFPMETLLGSTWNTEMIRQVGLAAGNEALEYGVDVLLAPAANIQRNPLNGRNFEYYSEDPYLSGKMAASMIRGVQENNVGTSLKHFAADNQETNRTGNDAVVSSRALREIYLKPFEIAVKEAAPWTVMTSYNKINGTYTSENADLLTTVLRDEWGFAGLVMSDWYGGSNAVRQIRAGNDLLMPGTPAQREALLAAVKDGTLCMGEVDRDVKRVLELIVKSPRFRSVVYTNKPNLDAHARTALQAAEEGMVLLENKNQALPLKAAVKNIALFGVMSYGFIPGGTGSSKVNTRAVSSLYTGLVQAGLTPDAVLQNIYHNFIQTEYAKMPAREWWYPLERVAEMPVPATEIDRAAKEQDFAVITLGRTSGEFLDRKLDGDFNLSPLEQALIENVCNAFHKENKQVAVILNISGVIETATWKNKPDAVLLAWLPGQEGGNAVVDLLTGKSVPSGKLPVTFPVNYADVASNNNFPFRDTINPADIARTLDVTAQPEPRGRKNFDYTVYNEGIYVGYRYYDTFNKPVSYPFGYGLSYTGFSYSAPYQTMKRKIISVMCEIKNIGKFPGKEVVQVYVSAPGKEMSKPKKELKAFAKTKLLEPGDFEKVTLTIPVQSLASFNPKTSSWVVEEGDYTIHIGSSSQDIRETLTIHLDPMTVEMVHPALLPGQKIDEM